MNLIFCLFWCCLWWGTSAHKIHYRKLVGVGKPNTTVLHKNKFVENKWFEQELDHFNHSDTRKWKQRYQMNGKYYKPGGPVFLLLGGEEEISASWTLSGAWIEYAKKLNALCFQLEHRYYGRSHPTDNLNDTNIVYLTIEQTLADFATFIHTVKGENKKILFNTKWVVFGGSYSGNLAAWLRLKYPQLVYAAVSSSSALRSKMNYEGYFMAVQNVLSDVNPKCVTDIREATSMISNLLKTDNGASYVDSKLNTCSHLNISNTKDMAQLFKKLAVEVAHVVQYNKDNRYSDNVMSTTSLCDIMLDKSLGNPLERYAIVHTKLRADNNHNCVSVDYKSTISSFKETSLNSYFVKSGDRQWFYQICTELGNFVTPNNRNHLFGNSMPSDTYTELCSNIFGELFNIKTLRMAVKYTNRMFNDLRKNTSRIIYLHGTSDPWSKLGLNQPQAKSVSIVIEGVAHCADVYPSRPVDPPQLKKARKTVVYYLKTWLQKEK